MPQPVALLVVAIVLTFGVNTSEIALIAAALTATRAPRVCLVYLPEPRTPIAWTK